MKPHIKDLYGRRQVIFSPFLIGHTPPHPPYEHRHPDAWKYANHNNIAIEPQLILCYEDFKDHHLPDIHNKGINGKEKV